MKKILNRLLALPLMAVAFVGCTNEVLTFEHEKPQFETRADAILLEVILPSSSSANDQFYIVGDFNGGQEAVVGNAEWQLSKASTDVAKWGIYLDPSKFVAGKTLADGFTFYSEAQGQERSARNEPVTHTLDVAVGSRTNVWINQWETFFGERPRDWSRVYLYNQRGWEEIALYCWGDGLSDPFGGWPGMQPSGTETVNGLEFTYFDIDKSLDGLILNLIPNNNGGGEQVEDESVSGWTVEGDLYVALTATGGVVMDPDNLVAPYKGHKVYIDDQSGWGDLALFAWHNYSPVDAGYPGWQVSGTEIINDVEYKYFMLPETLNDHAFSLVFNNNVPADSPDKKEVQGPAMEKFSEDVYYKLSESGFEVANPYGIERKIYVDNLIDWEAVALHYWGDGVAGTAWPGLQPSGAEEIGGVSYIVFTLPGELDGKAINFILNNNNNGVQLAAYPISPVNRDYHFRIPANPVNNVTAPEPVTVKIYIDDQTGWDAIRLHYWGDGVTGTAWPGIEAIGTEDVDAKTYTVFELPTELTGKSLNWILNNNGAGAQFDCPYIPLIRDNYYTATATGVTEVE